ncbi:DoxX family protein [Pedobacter sp. JY14-1]|uniref:DoxX family protein n=1 Tax=Pedobacter sp. JY14-1 TaxID=3034151 RepID=UPI0023E18DA4|nr:DoxX family protein [Pedobacter sp. JY14-1]
MTVQQRITVEATINKYKIIFWVATAILILWEGVMPLSTVFFAPEYVNAGTKPLGYPDYFAYTLIVCKVLGVIAISLPKIPGKVREWAYAGLTFNLIFAFISHAAVDRNIGFMLLPIVVLGILAISYAYGNKIRKEQLA